MRFILFYKPVEKALKAGQFSVVLQKKNSHDLRSIAISLGNAQIIGLALSMTNVVGDSYKMRYPDCIDFPNIPHDVYTRDMAIKSVEIATQILNEIPSQFL